MAGTGGVAGTVGVAASGVDVPYPLRHRALWQRVVRTGAIVSETPPGRAAQAWRFPARNRIIAGLAKMVVVVESHAGGGSLITAEAAIDRGIEVRVVPGPVHSPASAGSNQLLYDGPGPVRDAQDVLDGLGILRSTPRPSSPPHERPRGARRPPESRGGLWPPAAGGWPEPGLAGRAARVGLDPAPRAVLDALGWRPTSLNEVVERCALTVAAAARALDELEVRGLVAREGGWWTRTARRS